MNYDGELQRMRQLKLFQKYLLLNVPRRMVVIKIQAYFPYGHYFIVCACGAEIIIRAFICGFSIMRMNSHGGVNIVIFLSQIIRILA